MTVLRYFFKRLRALWRPDDIHDEISEEMRFHIELRAEENVRSGMMPQEARRKAEQQFGRLDRIKEEGYDVRGGRWLEATWQDLRYGARMLMKQPGFTLIAVITLALGIGANTAIFSVVNAVLLRPLPYRDAGRLVVPVSVNPARGTEDGNITYADYLDWKKEQVFAHVAAIDNTFTNADLSGDTGEPERVNLAVVTEDYFAVLGVAPLLGRAFQADDYNMAWPPRTLILSDSLWRRRYGGDAQIIGQNIYLNGRPYQVVGVVAKAAVWPQERDVFLPLAVGPSLGADLQRRDNMIFLGLARLKPDTAIEQTNAVLATMARRLARDYPEARQGWSNQAKPLLDYAVGKQLRTSLLVLLAAVAFVLLIACINVANLLLTRAATREHELALRLALGAGRGHLLRQMLTESLLLALLGGGLGLLLAIWGIDLLTALVPTETPRLEEIKVSGGVLVFTLAVTLLTALLCGLLPAWQATRTNLNTTLKEAARTASGGVLGRRWRGALVIIEVASALVLLVGAGLLLRSFARVQQTDPGLRVEGLVTMELNAAWARYPDGARVAAFYRALLERIKATPGVESAALSSALPLNGGGFYLGRVFLAEGWPEPPAGTDIEGQWNVVSPDYFKTTGTRLIKGRDFDERDSVTGNPVIIVNEAFARRAFPNEDPLGKRVRSWRDENKLRQIVGVVADMRYYGRDDELRGLVYVPHAQNTWNAMALNMRTQGDPAALGGALREQIKTVDKDLAIANLQTMTTVLNRSLAPRRASMLLLTVFAVIAALLAALGIYGVLAYAVAQRTHEIGIRLALGAGARDVLRLVIGQGMRPVLLGVVLGLAGAFGLTRVMKSLLYDVSPTDPLTFGVIALLLLSVALLACWLPARRATQVDPLIALRTE
jgi:putative ABC transport system permease protein